MAKKGQRFSSPVEQRYLNLITAQVRSGHTNNALAQLTGIHPVRLSQLMYGHRNPQKEDKQKLSQIFGKSEGYLFRRPNCPVKSKRGPKKGTPSPKKGKTYGAVKEQAGDVDGQVAGGAG